MKKAITLSGSNQKKANGLKISSDMPKFTKFIGSCDTLKKSAAGPSAGSSLLIPSKPKRRQSYQTLERLTGKAIFSLLWFPFFAEAIKKAIQDVNFIVPYS